MAIDFTRYQTPGIYTEDIGGPQLSVFSSVPTAVAIFGLTVGYQTYRQSITINPDTDSTHPAMNQTLAKQGIETDTVKVINPTTGQQFELGTDYVITRVAVGEDATPNTQDDLYTIQRVIDGGHIDQGDTVQISYNYTDPNYFEVFSLFDYDDVRDFYGDPYDASGNLQSELSLAAWFAFTNGASQLLACAVKPSSSTPTIEDYADALDKFRDEDQIAIIVPATGQQPLHALVQQHVVAQSNNRYERRAIVGLDGSVAPLSSSQRITFAEELTERRVALISPDRFQYYAPELNREVTLGGQFMAAAVAGKAVSQSPAMPLTAKNILGFRGPTVAQRDGEKALESANGLMVIEKTRRNQIQVRHGVTTDPRDLLHREWNIIAQQDVMVFRIRDYLSNDGLIGMPIFQSTLIQVKASTQSALENLVDNEVIVGYQNLKVRQIGTQPDVIEARFEWRPAYPLNYIVVRYSVAVETGDVTIADTTL